MALVLGVPLFSHRFLFRARVAIVNTMALEYTYVYVPYYMWYTYRYVYTVR